MKRDETPQEMCERVMRIVTQVAGRKLLQALEFVGQEQAAAEKAAFERGYQGALSFAIAVCDERGADVAHIKTRCSAALTPHRGAT